jgi:hypothetical protein
MASDARSQDGRHEQHSTYSASSAHRWSRPDGCPASAILAKLAPPKPSSPAALEGTQAHDLLEKRLKSEPVVVGDWPAKAWEGVSHAVDLVNKLSTPETQIWVEEKLSWPVVDWLPPEDEVYGFGDAVLWTPYDDGNNGRLDIVDYKNGVHPVDPEGNRQLLQYTHSALSTLPFFAYSLDVHVHIVQPNRYDGAEPVQSWEVPPEALAQYEAEARAAIESNAIYHLTGSLDGLTYRPSAENCHWCPGFGSCEAAKAEATKHMRGYDGAHCIRASHVASTTLKNEELPDLLIHADYLEVWVKEIRALAFDRAKNGASIPGWKLVQKGGKRFFTAPEKEVLAKLYSLARVAYEEAMPRTLVSPAQAEKLVRAKLKGLGHADKDIKKSVEKLAFLTDKTASENLDLVEVSDKRPAVDARQKFFGAEPPKLPSLNESAQS